MLELAAGQLIIAIWLAVCLGGFALIAGGVAGRFRSMIIVGATLLFVIGGSFLWWFGIRPGAVDCPEFLRKVTPQVVCPAPRL